MLNTRLSKNFTGLVKPIFWVLICALSSAASALEDDRETSTLSVNTQKEIAEQIEIAIRNAKLPGCVIAIGNHSEVLHLAAYGQKQTIPNSEPMTTDTVFDLASLTKPIATGMSIMKLVEQKRIHLSDRVASYLPEFGNNGKESLRITDLLVHRSGLIPDNSISDYEMGPEIAWDRICDLPLTAPIGATFKYSDVNFIVLGKLVEKVSGVGLDLFSKEQLFDKVGMNETGFNPNESLRMRAAPTEQRDGKWIRGEVHDPRAFKLGGVAGHAGLFSTAKDLVLFAQSMLNHGRVSKQFDPTLSVLSADSIRLMTLPIAVANGKRALAWDKQSAYSTNRGVRMSAEAFGHGGFTGTVLWIDPSLDLFFVFLSNRVHPDGKGSVNALAGAIWDRSIDELRPKSATSETGNEGISEGVLTGVDVLGRDGLPSYSGKRVGLITNQTGRNRIGESTVSVLKRSSDLKLTTLFSPEHGFNGNQDLERIDDTVDSESGFKVYSLYGIHRKPTSEMLADVDMIVFDIQDIGTRFYTYMSTMGESMKAAAEHKKTFLVLDRPNPIGGDIITGPMLDDGPGSFVRYHSLPVRHGMTAGELALLFKKELSLDLELAIIPCENWSRNQYWDSTGLRWVNPSPNIRSLNQALLYSGIGLLEFTNLSVGRGTDAPFEWIGAPWIDPQLLALYLNQQKLPGVRFYPVEFTPTSSQYANEVCRGVRIEITDRVHFEPIQSGLTIALGLARFHPDRWETKDLNLLLGNSSVVHSILRQETIEKIREHMDDGLGDFAHRREGVLLYPDRKQK